MKSFINDWFQNYRLLYCNIVFCFFFLKQMQLPFCQNHRHRIWFPQIFQYLIWAATKSFYFMFHPSRILSSFPFFPLLLNLIPFASIYATQYTTHHFFVLFFYSILVGNNSIVLEWSPIECQYNHRLTS